MKKIVIKLGVKMGDYSTPRDCMEDVMMTVLQRCYDVDGVFLSTKDGIAYCWKEV